MSTEHRPVPVLEHLDRDGVMALGREWDGVVAASPCPSPFLAWPWIAAWLDTFGAEADLEVVTARDPADDRLVGIAPFFVSPIRRRGARCTALRLLGSGPLAPSGVDMPIAADPTGALASRLWMAVSQRRRWDLIDLDGVAEGGALARILMRRRSDAAHAQATARSHVDLIGGAGSPGDRLAAAPLVDLSAPSDGPVATAPNGHGVERLVVAAADLEATMNRMARMTEVTHHPRAGHAPVAHPSVHGFHREAARRLLAAGRLRLWRLDIEDDIVAAVYAARFDGTVVCFAAAVDARWRSRSAAMRLLARAVRGAEEEGADRFVLPPGGRWHAPAWETATRRDLRIQRPTGARGRLLWAGRRAGASLRGRPKTRRAG
jgi:hypothetical protein